MLLKKGVVNKGKNRNLRFVRVKQDRECKYCGAAIRAGSECITINKYKEGRKWVCLECLEAISRYKETKAQLNFVPFGDEAAYMALSYLLAEESAELYERGVYFTNMLELVALYL